MTQTYRTQIVKCFLFSDSIFCDIYGVENDGIIFVVNAISMIFLLKAITVIVLLVLFCCGPIKSRVSVIRPKTALRKLLLTTLC